MNAIKMLTCIKLWTLNKILFSFSKYTFLQVEPFYRAIIAVRTYYSYCTHQTTSNGHICVFPDRVSSQSLLSHNPPNEFFHESPIFIPFYGIRKLSSVFIGVFFFFLIRYFIFILNPKLENNFV